MDVARKLDHEWPQLAAKVGHALPRWQHQQPQLGRFSSPRQLLAFLHSAAAEQTDQPLLALLALAREEQLAGRTLLQMLLPALKTRAGRIVHPASRREEVWELLLYSAWEAIRCYPLERRRVRVAANLVLQVVHQTTRELRRQALADDERHLHNPDWHQPNGRNQCEAAPRDMTLDKPAAPEPSAEAVLSRGVEAGVLSSDEAELILLTRVDGITLRLLASEFGISYEALLKRRQRAEAALRQLLAPADRVRNGPVSDPVSLAGLLRYRRPGGAECASGRHAARAA